MTKLDFSALNKNASTSFHQQRNLIKKVFKGDKVSCPTCNQPITMLNSNKEQVHIGCKKGCTAINMDKE